MVPAANVPEEELFLRAQDWLAELGSTHTVVQKVSNPEAGLLISHVKAGNAFDGKAFRLAIQVKDGHYQYQIDQITHTYSDYARAGKYSVGTVTTNIEAYGLRRQRKGVIKTIDKIDRWILATIDGLNAAMKRPEEASNLI
ncbi:hypothetical protein GCM10011383_25030 [Hymenobacter cavernae]|uniref:DUF4468 domain-containing protein n=1 Tax=Hymenobacter cavernae TaxID=2044852 RepID=A0ABQ1U9U0_9BACT|nr:hypothetical protein GCM10011383_25030 [Hymenobacter cavernae]